MEVDDYRLLKKGFLNKRVYEQSVIRRAVISIMAPWLKQAPDAYKFWPLPGDEEERKRIAEKRDEAAMRILERHKKNNITYVMVGKGKERKIVEVINKES